MKPTLFIGSSTERLSIARALKDVLAEHADVTVWEDAPEFQLGLSLLHGLTKVGERYDFALLVFGQDDRTMMSGVEVATVRDNVIFELGLFMGHMGRGRALWLSPRGANAPYLVDDLKGIMHLEFDEPDLTDSAAVIASLMQTREKVEQQIRALGIRALGIRSDRVRFQPITLRLKFFKTTNGSWWIVSSNLSRVRLKFFKTTNGSWWIVSSNLSRSD